MTTPFMHNFRISSNKFLKIFLSLILRIALPSKLFFRRKRKIFRFENVVERGFKEILTFVKI